MSRHFGSTRIAVDGDVDGMTGRPMNLRISSQQKP